MLAVSMSPPVMHYPVVQKRPKLSLQTSQLPISYGTSSRGLSTIATPTAAVTPTTLNTFSNTYDLTNRPSPTTAIASPTILRTPSIRDRVSRSQSPRPKRIEAAYTVNLPYGIKPILKNSPFPRVRTNSISASPRSSTRRVFFPAPKQVHFRNVIEEEITTHVYTACHSDFFEEDATSVEKPEQSAGSDAPETIVVSTEQSDEGSSISISSSQRRKTRRNSIDLFGSGNTSSNQNTTSLPPVTPARTRKRRKWEWTLEPVPSSPPSSSSSSDSDSESGSAETSESDACQEDGSSKPELDRTESTPTTAAQPQSDAAQPKTSEHQNQFQKSQPPSSPSSTSRLLKSRPGQSESFPGQRRTISLDTITSPRKRKAECLVDTDSPVGFVRSLVAIASSSTDKKLDDSAITDSTPVGNVSKGNTGQSGPKRRERRLTL